MRLAKLYCYATNTRGLSNFVTPIKGRLSASVSAQAITQPTGKSRTLQYNEVCMKINILFTLGNWSVAKKKQMNGKNILQVIIFRSTVRNITHAVCMLLA